jgi:hypothetical protein
MTMGLDVLLRVAAVAAVRVVLQREVGGLGRLPAAQGRAVALRVEPPGYRRLAPDGLPSLTQHGQAGGAGGHHVAARSRARGAAGFVVRHAAHDRRPPGDRAGSQVAALGARASRTPPRSPPRPQPGRWDARGQLGPARPPRQSLACGSLGGTSAAGPPTLVSVGGPFAASAQALGCPVAARRAGSAHRDPPSCAPVPCEGDLWGDLQCGGPVNRLAVSVVRSRRKHTPPPARP